MNENSEKCKCCACLEAKIKRYQKSIQMVLTNVIHDEAEVKACLSQMSGIYWDSETRSWIC